jgi:uncharacterized membrane protein
MSNLGVTEIMAICMFVLMFGIVILIPYWRIFAKAGFSPRLSLLMIVPLANIVMLYYLGFKEWPSLEETPKSV